MTTTAKRTDLLEREARFAALVRSGTSHVDAMFGAGYRPTSPSSAASFLRKLLARPRIVAAIGDERLVRRMRDRGPVLRLLPATDVALLERVVELALASGSATRPRPTRRGRIPPPSSAAPRRRPGAPRYSTSERPGCVRGVLGQRRAIPAGRPNFARTGTAVRADMRGARYGARAGP